MSCSPTNQNLILLPHSTKAAVFEIPTDPNHYVELRKTNLALKMKLVHGRGYETYNTEEVKKEHTA